MKALVYHGPGQKALEDRPKPEIAAPTDAIVRITKTTICGTDLHILKGDVPTCAARPHPRPRGRRHRRARSGSAVTAFKPGDRVLISCITACGKCDYCRKRHVLALHDRRLDPRQQHRRHAGRVRAHPACRHEPLSDPAGADEEALVMLSDILPTGFECGVLNGKVEPGSTVAIVGAGPIGLAALLTAQFYSPAEIIMIDLDDNRLEVAQALRRDARSSTAPTARRPRRS